MDNKNISITKRIDKRSKELENALSSASSLLLELAGIYDNEAIPPGHRKTATQIEDMEILADLLGTLWGALSEHGTTSAQDEIFRETLNVLRAIKHLRKLDELDEL